MPPEDSERNPRRSSACEFSKFRITGQYRRPGRDTNSQGQLPKKAARRVNLGTRPAEIQRACSRRSPPTQQITCRIAYPAEPPSTVQFCRNIGQGSRPVRKRRLRHLRFRVRSMLGFQDRLGHIRIVGHEPDGALAVCFKERSGKLCRPLAARTVNIVAFRPKIASARTENMAATNSELHGITFTDVR